MKKCLAYLLSTLCFTSTALAANVDDYLTVFNQPIYEKCTQENDLDACLEKELLKLVGDNISEEQKRAETLIAAQQSVQYTKEFYTLIAREKAPVFIQHELLLLIHEVNHIVHQFKTINGGVESKLLPLYSKTEETFNMCQKMKDGMVATVEIKNAIYETTTCLKTEMNKLISNNIQTQKAFEKLHQANEILYVNMLTFKSDCYAPNEETGKYHYGCGTLNESILSPSVRMNALVQHLSVVQENLKSN